MVSRPLFYLFTDAINFSGNGVAQWQSSSAGLQVLGSSPSPRAFYSSIYSPTLFLAIRRRSVFSSFQLSQALGAFVEVKRFQGAY